MSTNGIPAAAIVFEDGPVATLTIDRELTILLANRAAETLLGAPRASLIGAPLDRWIEPRGRPALRALIDAVYAGGRARLGGPVGDLALVRDPEPAIDVLID